MESQQFPLKLVPPLNFACVEEGLFRSACPYALNLPFVSDLKLDTVVWMALEEPSQDFIHYIEQRNLKFLKFGLSEITTVWESEVEDKILGALSAIADKTNGRILVCCTMGRHRTGTLIGCLRRMENWSLVSAFAEYRRFTGAHRYRIINELHIETFNRESVILPEPEMRQTYLQDI